MSKSKKEPRVVNILGKGDGWEAIADVERGLIYGINDAFLRTPNVDATFHMHDMEAFLKDPKTNSSTKLCIEYANANPDKEFYTIYQWNKIPHSKAYPFEEISERFKTNYFASTIEYAIAYALWKGCDVMNLYGINMTVKQEYCIDPTQRILMHDLTWREVRDVSEGDEIVAFDEENSDNHYRKYRKAIIEGVTHLNLPKYIIKLSDGTELISSAEHRWMAQCGNTREWRTVEQLMHGKPSRLVKIFEPWEVDSSRDAGYLAGVMDGEGYYDGGTRRLVFSQNQNECLDDTLAAANRLGFEFGIKKSKNDKTYCCRLIGGRQSSIEFLGRIRPRRLLAKFNADNIGELYNSKYEHPYVVSIEPIGSGELIGLKTSTGTMIVEGIASHNSDQKPGCEFWIGMAMGMGIEVNLQWEHSSLLKTRNGLLYGYNCKQGRWS